MLNSMWCFCKVELFRDYSSYKEGLQRYTFADTLMIQQLRRPKPPLELTSVQKLCAGSSMAQASSLSCNM